ncbi:MAG: ATP-binding protein, partial [Planctomycetota bacterium]
DGYADPDQLRQVMLNLAVNAIESMHGRPQPVLSFKAVLAGEDNPLDEDAVRLSVGDSGAGIPRDQIDRVFTPFWSTKPQGTGLGLSVVSRIIREHEGALRIVKEPGHGTEVVIFLPIVTQTRSFKRALGGV